MKYLLPLCLLLLTACTGKKVEYVDPLPWDDEDCLFLKKKLDHTPEEMVKQLAEDMFLGKNMDAKTVGEFLEYCPGKMAGGDFIEVISSYKILGSRVEKEKAAVFVEYKVLGRMSHGGSRGELTTFTKDVQVKKIEYPLVMTPYGWRIEDYEVGQKVSVKHIPSFFLERGWVKGNKEEFEQTVKAAEK